MSTATDAETTQRPVQRGRQSAITESDRVIAEAEAAVAAGQTPSLSIDDYSWVIEGWNKIVRRYRGYAHRESQVAARQTACRERGHLWALCNPGVMCVRCCTHQKRVNA